ncbi:MAG: DNA polymerase III subunit beta [Pseudonocardiaceae bacterium]
MRFRSERDQLLETLTTTSRAASSRGGGAPSLSGVRIEVTGDQVGFVGTDLDLTVRTGFVVSDTSDGVCVVPARLATDIVRSMPPGAVRFSEEGGEAVISAGRSRFTLRLLPVEGFLRTTEASGDPVALEATSFSAALSQVVKAASRDDARAILTGVLMAAEAGGLRLVATDSYRLALRDLPSTSFLAEGQQVLVPARALSDLTRILSGATEVTLRLGQEEASFQVGQTRLTTRLIEGDFPNYQQLIPSSYPNRLVVEREPFLDALRRVKLLAREATPVRLGLRADGLTLTAVTQDVGQATEEVDAQYAGEEMVVAFNPDFLIEGIEAVGGAEVSIETVDPLKPATLRPVGSSDYLYLLMPVRVS